MSGTGQTETIKTLGILNRTHTHTKVLCQKNQGTANFKQKPVTDLLTNLTTYRHLSPKRTPFENGTDSPLNKRCLEKDETTTHLLCEWEAIAYLGFHLLGHHLMELDDYHGTLMSRILHFIQSVGLMKN